MSSRTHITVYGATGFTARAIVEDLWKGGGKRWPAGFKWAIAGRNRSALETLRDSLTKESSSIPLPEIIIADVKDEESLNTMAAKTQLLLNCVGPYRDYGEPVVKACLHARTDYIDLCGEPAFIERMHLLYHEVAVKDNILICHAVAFDSVPCDLGVNLCKKLLAAKGAHPSSVEMILSINSTQKPAVNFATYEAAIKGFSSTKELRDIRKKLAAIRPKPAPVGPPLNMKPGGANAGILGRAGVSRDPQRGTYLVPYFFSDPAVVRLTQSLELYIPNTNPPDSIPVHFGAHIEIPTLKAILLFIVHFIIFQFLAVKDWGRNLLYTYPGLFTWGVVKRGNITKEEIEGTSFIQTFRAKGYSDSLHPTPANTPDISLTMRISGPEPGYIATPIIFLEVASVLLRKRSEFKNGVLTPTVAFGHLDRPVLVTGEGEGGVMNALQRDGRVMWSVVESN